MTLNWSLILLLAVSTNGKRTNSQQSIENKGDIEDLRINYNNLVDEVKRSIDTIMQNFDSLNKTMQENLERLSNETAEQRKEIISWVHQRSHLHEDILKTKISVCAHDFGHSLAGVVKYGSSDGGYLNDPPPVCQVANTTTPVEKVLDRTTGKFNVPEDAAGLYMFTFTVVMDTYQHGSESDTPEYVFRKGDKEFLNTEIMATVGNGEQRDQIPGSRTIVLKLVPGDNVDIYQKNDHDVTDRAVTFCGTLLHLERAAPGQFYANSQHQFFPTVTTSDFEAFEFENASLRDDKVKL